MILRVEKERKHFSGQNVGSPAQSIHEAKLIKRISAGKLPKSKKSLPGHFSNSEANYKMPDHFFLPSSALMIL